MSIQITVNPLTSLENILEKISAATNGQVELSVVRKGLFKNEISISVHPNTVIEEVQVPVIHEIVKRMPKTSKYRGVSKFRGQYYARISHNGKSKFIGSYTNELDAARAYNIAAKELHGSNAVLNVIDIV